MLFHSFSFIVFFILFYPIFRLVSGRFKPIIILTGSYFFYGSWNWNLLYLIFISTVSDYFCALIIHSVKSGVARKLFLMLSIAVNLGLLGFFKYFNFFVDSFSELMNLIGFSGLDTLNIVLPVGISFYTFQTMSYTIDVYRRQINPEKNFIRFAAYVAYFPQLIAGPIERAEHLLIQFRGKMTPSSEQLRSGMLIFLEGLFLKVVLADNLSPVTAEIFNTRDVTSGLLIWVGSMAYAIQIYCDFCGYSCMARGISRLMGIHLIQNFRFPYMAVNPRDFWKRWHISLSGWFRDYLYIPLGGNQKGAGRTFLNLTIVMGLCGLWHGAGWNFVIWGLVHAFIAILYEVASKLTRLQFPVFVKRLIVFQWWSLAFIFFRSFTLSDALFRFRHLFSGFKPTESWLFTLYRMMFFGFLFVLFELLRGIADFEKIGSEKIRLHPFISAMVALVVFYTWAYFGGLNREVFIYFQF